MLDYTFQSTSLYFKHHITQAPPCDAFSMHTHNMFELLYFISGDATHIIEDRKYKLKKGDLILIRPSKYHFIQIDSSVPYERYDILFDEKALGIDTNRIPSDTDVINLSSNTVASGILKKTDYYFAELEHKDFVSVLTLLLKELFLCLCIKENYSTTEYSVINPLLSKALRYINMNLFTLTSVKEVASALFITESYLFRLFKKELKNTPKRYITDKRLLISQNLILMGKKPTEIYEDCGFTDYTSFYRSYMKFFGHSPSADMKKGASASV